MARQLPNAVADPRSIRDVLNRAAQLIEITGRLAHYPAFALDDTGKRVPAHSTKARYWSLRGAIFAASGAGNRDNAMWDERACDAVNRAVFPFDDLSEFSNNSDLETVLTTLRRVALNPHKSAPSDTEGGAGHE